MAKSTAAYQAAAAEGATLIGLTILVHDGLVKDLLLAAESCRRREIEARCRALSHAFQLLGHLESWRDQLGSPTLAATLQTYYSMLRGRMLLLQASPQAAHFEELAGVVGRVRASWQEKESALRDVVRERALTNAFSLAELNSSDRGSSATSWTV